MTSTAPSPLSFREVIDPVATIWPDDAVLLHHMWEAAEAMADSMAAYEHDLAICDGADNCPCMEEGTVVQRAVYPALDTVFRAVLGEELSARVLRSLRLAAADDVAAALHLECVSVGRPPQFALPF